MSEFTWVPFYKELATILMGYRDRQEELIALLQEAKDQGLSVISLSDKTSKNKMAPLAAIDPFTFFAAFNRKVKNESRQAVLAIVKDRLGVQAPVPADFDGIPIMNPLKARFIPWRYEQQTDDVVSLWALAEAVVSGSPKSLTPALFDRCLSIKCVGVTNLTMGLFWMRPETYLALDKRNRELLGKRGIAHEVSDWASYLDFMDKARPKVQETPFEFSRIAYTGGSDPNNDGVLSQAECRKIERYWKVSHGKESFTDQQRKQYLQEHTIHAHKDTKKGQGKRFATEMKEGSLFYLCHGNDDGIRILGRVSGPATPSPRGDGWLQRPYEVIFGGLNPAKNYSGLKKRWTPNYNSTCMEVPESELKIFESNILKPFFGKSLADIPGTGFSADFNEPSSVDLPSKNIILYGPPGTGKTYALRTSYMQRFTDFQSAKTREQFAEELVSDLSWWEVTTLAMLDLDKAKVADILAHPLMKARIARSENRNPRAAIWSHLQTHTKRECENVAYSKRYEPLLFEKSRESLWSIDRQAASAEVPELAQKLETFRNYSPSKGAETRRYEFTTFHQSFSYEDFVEGIKPVMGDEASGELSYEIRSGIFRKIALRAKNDPDHDYALFIDEINRGNVASVFGELITLLEDDKRLGGPRELTAVLPYSQDVFGVPSNLYVIGTMNTADRSVEALDTALRRRFTFIECAPKPELLKNEQPADLAVDLEKLLTTINARIERLLDADHCIGHSYLMGLKEASDPLAALRHAFANKVLPLLKEYFYGDPGRVGMVLGKAFVRRRDRAAELASGDWDLDGADERDVFEFKNPMDLAVEDFESIYA